MDDLPPPLIVEILTRLNDSAALARCRAASKTLNALSRDVRSINLLCTFDRYAKSRSPETKTLITPFKDVLKNLVLKSSGHVDLLSVGVEKPLPGTEYDDLEDESDDLFLTDVRFVGEWLPRVCERLRYLAISDFWIQSCCRRSDVLSLISSCCSSLVNLEIKNAWLSVDGLKVMSSLKSLTLEFIRLDDEDLNKLNESFPSLEVLNLIGVGNLNNPKIHLLHLKTCLWTISNAPLSLSILAPSLIKLKLCCVRPKSLVLETPVLSKFHLSLDNADKFEVKEFLCLETLWLESPNLCRLTAECSFGRRIKKLLLDSPVAPKQVEHTYFSLDALFNVFPNMSSLTLFHGAWSEVGAHYRLGGLVTANGMKGLKELIVYVVVYDVEGTLGLILSVVDKCANLLDMALLIHRDVDASCASSLISKCTAGRPGLRWRWGMWKEGTKDTWV